MNSSIWIYPWDLLDEGMDVALGRIADAGIQSISLATAYHSIRALCPHNPKRAVYHGEGGVVYFHPQMSDFAETPIKPVLSNLVEASDVLDVACIAAERHGLKVNAWTVLHHNTRLGTEHPGCSMENAFGDLYPFALCPANPAVRAYTRGLVKSLASRPAIDTIELESLGYMGISHSGHHAKSGVQLDEAHRFLLSICFCEHCIAVMQANNVDVRRVRNNVISEIRAVFEGNGGKTSDDTTGALEAILGADVLDGILASRDEVVLSLLEDLYWLVEKPQKLATMVSASPLATGAPIGATLSEVRDWTDVLLVQSFHKETASIKEEISDVAVRRGSAPVHAGLQAISPFVGSSRDLVERVQAVASVGADSVAFYHYGLMPLANLSWIRDALASV